MTDPRSQNESSLAARMPPGAWDSHIHVVDTTRYPLADTAAYNPTGIYSVWDNALFESSIGQERVVIIQPSIFGHDNTAVIDALKALGPARARAVVEFDPTNISQAQLQEWHALGVRGVRVNLGFVGEKMPTIADFKKTLALYADIVRPLGWAIQVYIEMKMIADLEELIPTLAVPFIFDHMGHPDVPVSADGSTFDPYSLHGFGSLIRLLKGGNMWTKISAPYRLSEAPGPEYLNMDPLIKEFFKEAPDQLVFASDWPHTLFEGLDIKPWIGHLLDLVGEDEELKVKLFRDNARRLWG